MRDPQNPLQPAEPGPIRQLGDYVLEAQIGRGGMGVVYRARRESTGDVVALKLMAPELAGNEDYRARFVREATLAPSLDHPNIVPIYECGEADGELFIAMKLVEGSDLKDVIRREGRLDPGRAVRIFRQAADALDASHEAGMIHRDVKPQNILVSPGASERDPEHVYLTDFGLVRPVASETASRTGQVFGSVPYMAPELIEGLPADGRADVYGLGCVLYECLTGAVPFERDNEVAAVWAHIHEDPPLVTDKCSEVPGGVNDVLIKALSKHPDDRFLTCGEMVGALEIGLGRKLSHLKYAYVRPLVERMPRKKTEREVWSPNFFPELSRVRATSRKINWLKIGAFATACFLIASVQVGREGGLPQAVSDFAGAAGSAGRSLIDAVGSDEDEGTGTRRRGPRDPVISAENRPLSGVVGPQLPLETSEVDQTRALTSPTLRSVAPPDSPLSKSLVVFASNRRYPTSQRSADVGSMDLYRMRADGSRLRNLSPADTQKTDTFPHLSACGQLAFTRIDHATLDYSYTFFVLGPDGTVLLEENRPHNTYDIGWSPDCRQIVYRQESRLVIRDVYSGEWRVLINWPRPVPRYPQWSPDGTRIVFDAVPAGAQNENNVEIYVINVDGTGLTRLTSSPNAFDEQAHWSPDGTRIAFRRGVLGAGADANVWLMNADGSGQSQLTHTAGDDVPTGWSPDGHQIIFYTDREMRTLFGPHYRGDIYVMDADGTEERDLIPDGGGEEAWVAWQPPVYRTVSAHIEGTVLSGRATAIHAPCAVGRDVYIERQEGERWFAVDSVTTSSSGRFSYALPSEGTYRARLFLGRAKGGLLCGSALSRTRIGA